MFHSLVRWWTFVNQVNDL